MLATEFHNVHQALTPIIDDIRKAEGVNSVDDVYQIILRAVFVKSYEFNLYIAGLEGHTHSFYLTPTFRGICEDIIDRVYSFSERGTAVLQ